MVSYWSRSWLDFKPPGGPYGKAVCSDSDKHDSQRGQRWRINMWAYPCHGHFPSSSSSPRPPQQLGGRKQLGRGWGSTRCPSLASPAGPEDSSISSHRTLPTTHSIKMETELSHQSCLDSTWCASVLPFTSPSSPCGCVRPSWLAGPWEPQRLVMGRGSFRYSDTTCNKQDTSSGTAMPSASRICHLSKTNKSQDKFAFHYCELKSNKKTLEKVTIKTFTPM